MPTFLIFGTPIAGLRRIYYTFLEEYILARNC